VVAGWLIEKEIKDLFLLKMKKSDALMTGSHGGWLVDLTVVAGWLIEKEIKDLFLFTQPIGAKQLERLYIYPANRR